MQKEQQFRGFWPNLLGELPSEDRAHGVEVDVAEDVEVAAQDGVSVLRPSGVRKEVVIHLIDQLQDVFVQSVVVS